MTIILRADTRVQAPALLRKTVRDMDSQLAVFNTQRMDERINQSAAQPRLNASLIALFALFAVLPAAVGGFSGGGSGATGPPRQPRGPRRGLCAVGWDGVGGRRAKPPGSTMTGATSPAAGPRP